MNNFIRNDFIINSVFVIVLKILHNRTIKIILMQEREREREKFDNKKEKISEFKNFFQQFIYLQGG